MKLITLLAAAGLVLGALTLTLTAADPEPGFKSLFDGKTFAGWKMADENTNTWKIEDGAFVAHGNRCHLFYVGDEQPFTNFELKVDVMTKPGANGGIYFHTKYQATSWPKYGFETQVNNSGGDWRRTASLYSVKDNKEKVAEDGKWWTHHIIVQGKRVIVKVDGKVVTDYTEPEGTQAGKDFTRVFDKGTFAFQAHDPKSIVHYKNVQVKRLD